MFRGGGGHVHIFVIEAKNSNLHAASCRVVQKIDPKTMKMDPAYNITHNKRNSTVGAELGPVCTFEWTAFDFTFR